jgi:hypothetical protein
MEIMTACLLSLALLFGTVIIHYEVLRAHPISSDSR